MPMPLPYDHRMDPTYANWVNGGYLCGPMMPPTHAPYVEHQKAVTIRNDVNVQKETLRIEPDEDNPSKYLVAFDFDATVPGSQLAVKAEAFQDAQSGPEDGNVVSVSTNSHITIAVFEKDKDEFKIRVVKQILWVSGMRGKDQSMELNDVMCISRHTLDIQKIN
ncbi:hypothetical protein K7X08_007177 [Anisodus acutangulus]|uniref:RING-type E3 ubiquitin transferase n=1 Tax=Anisodus acutangulus TaxID=402998 RepID=A0A9Q1QZP1_9SOLA|nr:hypothetical protein K7X08_007177 [Anisodus acutangulus]